MPNSQQGAATVAMGGYTTVILIIATHAVMVLSTAVVWKLAMLNWGVEQLGEYLLSRRVINVVQLPLICVTQLGLIRFGSMAFAQRDMARARCFQVSALFLAAMLSLGVFAVMNVWPDFCSDWLFGVSGNRTLVRASSVAIAGMLFHSVVWSQFWAQTSVLAASLLQMTVLATPTLWMLLSPTLSVSATILAMGLTWILIHGVVLIIQVPAVKLRVLRPAEVRDAMRQLLRYGVPRVPGGLAAAALFSTPVILAAHQGGLMAATYVGTGVSLLTMTATLIKPFTLAVLSTASQMLVTNDVAVLRRAAIQFGIVGGAIAAIVVVLAELMLPSVLTWYLGEEFLMGTGIIRILLLAVLPYSIFVLLRDFLDAIDERPFNTRNLSISFGVFLAMSVAGSGAEHIAQALAVALVLLAGLTIHETSRALKRIAHLEPTTGTHIHSAAEIRAAA